MIEIDEAIAMAMFEAQAGGVKWDALTSWANGSSATAERGSLAAKAVASRGEEPFEEAREERDKWLVWARVALSVVNARKPGVHVVAAEYIAIAQDRVGKIEDIALCNAYSLAKEYAARFAKHAPADALIKVYECRELAVCDILPDQARSAL